MSRKKDDRSFQDYQIGHGAAVRVFYTDEHKPAMLHDDDTALISFGVDKFDGAKRAILMGGNQYAPVPSKVAEIPGRSRDLTPEQRNEAMARIGAVASDASRPRPVTSADLFAAAGVDVNILGTLERAAEEG